MIRSGNEYRFYLEADRIALGRDGRRPRLHDDVWKFERLLRKVEYYGNCRKSTFWRLYQLYLRHRFHTVSIRLNYSIPPNVFGPGLSISYPGTIVVNEHAQVGENCRLHVGVVIGTEAGYSDRAPRIGNCVYLGPGAKLFGPIAIADNIAVGANAVVNKSFLNPGVGIAGVPAREINETGSHGLVIDATGRLRGKTSSSEPPGP